MSMLGKWDPWYAGTTERKSYGDIRAYIEAEKWLKGLDVEDWGCGYAWFQLYHKGNYKGIDGTENPYVSLVADLQTYTSNVEGILLRGVLEHNYNWQKVLDNAVMSFTHRLCIVLFTPIVDETTVIVENVGNLGVPDIAFNINDIIDRIGCGVEVDKFMSTSGYGEETVIKAQR
jgi:hypothetical protein